MQSDTFLRKLLYPKGNIQKSATLPGFVPETWTELEKSAGTAVHYQFSIFYSFHRERDESK